MALTYGMCPCHYEYACILNYCINLTFSLFSLSFGLKQQLLTNYVIIL